jgi:subtilisin family serine protease
VCAGIAGALVAVAVLAVTVTGAVAGPRKSFGHGLGKGDHELIAQATAQGERTISLVLIADPSALDSTISSLKGLGAKILYRDAELGYIHATVPTDKAVDAAKATGVKIANVDRVVDISPPDPDTGVAPQRRGHAHQHERHGGRNTLPGLDAINPYMPTGDIGAPQFVRSHRTFDGRGVKVGIVDTGVDVDRPELQEARTLDGKKVPKITDWVTTTAPALGDAANGDPTWVPMAPVSPSGDRFTASGATFTLPRDRGRPQPHTWLFGVFSEGDPRLGGELGSDVNRDGDTTDSFGVLEDAANDTVWVDTNQNFRFEDDDAMQNYEVDRDISHFGRDNRATKDVVEEVPFTVQVHHPDPSVDGDAEYVNIGIVSGGHGTHVAGTVAGEGFFNGAYDGVAPGAQLAVARVCLFITGCATSAQIEAFLYLIRHDHVDEIQMSIGGLPPLNADLGDPNTEEYVVDQLTQIYGVQFFFSQGNDGPGANTSGSPGTASLAVGSGAYQSQDTWTANYGNTPPKQDTLWTFSSRGPNEDGALKPNLVSPGSELSTWPAWNMSENPFAGGTGARPYQLPPGYEMIQGTSMASPMTAGAGALLLSAARQSHVTVTPAQLRTALYSSTRFIPGYQAYEQGNGLTNVGAAWDVLRRGAVPEGTIVATAPVNTQLMQLVGLGSGVGLYEREGWAPGQSGNRTITFQGGSGSYSVTWKGDDHTFSSGGSVSFSGGNASLSVHIGPVTEGIHSAILQLDKPSTPGIDFETLATVVAAPSFDAAHQYQVTRNATVDRADKQAYFVTVPAGTSVLKLDKLVGNGRTRLDVIDPWGDPYALPLPCGCAEDYSDSGSSSSVAIQNPMAGVWEVDVEASRAATVDQSTTTLTASVLGVDITPSSWHVSGPATQAFSFTNNLAPFTGGAVGTAFGSAQVLRPTIHQGDQQAIFIDVPSGGTQLDVKIGNTSDPSSDLDLYVFDCTSGDCVLADQSAGPTANEEVRIDAPAAGQWAALVVGYAVPSGSTQYDYADTVSMPGLGSVTTDDSTSATHATGSTWSANATAAPAGNPGAGRTERAFVQVVSGGAVIAAVPVDASTTLP